MILLVAFTKYVGITAGVLTAVSMLPQLMKLIKEKKGGQVSMFMLLLLVLGLGLWTYYGILQEDWPIIVTNAFSFLLNVTMIVLSLYYKKQEMRSTEL